MGRGGPRGGDGDGAGGAAFLLEAVDQPDRRTEVREKAEGAVEYTLVASPDLFWGFIGGILDIFDMTYAAFIIYQKILIKGFLNVI